MSWAASVYEPILHRLIDAYYKHGEEVMGMIINSGFQTRVVKWKYRQLTPIPAEQRSDLLQYAMEKWPDKSPDELESIMECVYTIGTLL